MTTGNNNTANIDKITIENNVITDPLTIADNFNKFFTQAGQKIYNSVDPLRRQPCDYIPDRNTPLLNFNNITETVVLLTIGKMESKSSTDANGVN